MSGRPDREMACWSPERPTSRTFAVLLAETAAFASIMGLLFVVLVMAGCAPVVDQNYRVPSVQEQQAIAECRAIASTVTGYSAVNQAFNQEIALRNCLAARGVR